MKALKTVFATLFILAVVASSGSHAQNLRQISTYGVDFFVGYLPPALSLDLTKKLPPSYVILSSPWDSNEVTLSLFTSSGAESPLKTFRLKAGEAMQYTLPVGTLRPTRPGEMPEYKSVHITSTYPISAQYYADGANTGGAYQVIPTPGLGKQYRVFSAPDFVQSRDSNGVMWDSASSEFLLVAPYDNTHVTYTPSVITEANTRGTVTTTLQRGQTLWVRSANAVPGGSLSCTPVSSDKPIAVIAGHERAEGALPQMSDLMVQELDPVETWGMDYMVAPLQVQTDGPAPSSYGSLMYAGIDSTTWIEHYDQTTQHTLAVGPNACDQLPAVTQHELVAIPRAPSAARRFTAMLVSESDDSLGTVPPDLMKILPVGRWQRMYSFRVPSNSEYAGNQFVEIIGPRDTSVIIYRNGVKITPSAVGPRYGFAYQNRYVGQSYRMQPADYVITSSAPFGCYSYGYSTNATTHRTWGYATPCGGTYARSGDTTRPTYTLQSTCSGVDIHVSDSQSGDLGLAYVELLNDSTGRLYPAPLLSQNLRLSGNRGFEAGSAQLTVRLSVIDSTKPARGFVYIEDVGGNDTVIHYVYDPPFVVLEGDIAFTNISHDSCRTIHIYNPTGQAKLIDTIVVNDAKGVLNITGDIFAHELDAYDTLTFTVCNILRDTAQHIASITIYSDCFAVSSTATAKTVPGLLVAQDRDYGVIATGATDCAAIQLRNDGQQDLVITSADFSDSSSFYITTPLPITIGVGRSVTVNVCFTPRASGEYRDTIYWHTATSSLGGHDKVVSYLTGRAGTSDVAQNGSSDALNLASLSPNPATSVVELDIVGEMRSATLEIFDVTGARVVQSTLPGSTTHEMRTTIDVRRLPAGTYVLQLTSDRGVERRRVVIVR